MGNKKQVSYTRGKYNPRERKEGSVRWFMDRGFSQTIARKKAKEFKQNQDK